MLLVDRDVNAVTSLFPLIHTIRVVYTDQTEKSRSNVMVGCDTQSNGPKKQGICAVLSRKAAF